MTTWFAVGAGVVIGASGYAAGLAIGWCKAAPFSAQLATLSRNYAILDAEAVDLRAEAERLREEVWSLNEEAVNWSKIAQRHRFERDDARATLAASYVREGNRFVRWRPDGVYPAVARGPEGQTGSKTGQEAR